MCQVVAKNTFISFDCRSRVSASLFRSQSAESIREQRDSSARLALENQSVQRLNAVLSNGLSRAGSPKIEHDPVDLSELRDLQNRLGKALANGKPSPIDELRELCYRLGKTLANPPVESLLKNKSSKPTHNASCCSLSTMAPDDASDFSESSHHGISGMRHVLSCGSVSTMTSDSNEHGIANSCSKAFECTHSSVPRHQKWADMQDDVTMDELPTTLMIRNIPSRYSQQDLVLDLEASGFTGTFDFLYMPMDKNTCCNVGYGFVNFVDPYWARMCKKSFENYRFKSEGYHGSIKRATVSVAHLQGLAKNMQHYEKSAVNISKHVHRRPLVMPSICQAFN